MVLQTSYDPRNDIPSLTDKVFVITGGTNGLGRQAILALSRKHPAHIYFTGRNTSAANDLIAQVGSSSSTFIRCDHASLTSVQDAAHKLLSLTKRLDVLICNAGVMTLPPGLTNDGYEVHFGINHLSHALFIKLLLPLLERTSETAGEARVISIGSLAAEHTPTGGIAFNDLHTPQTNLWLTGKWQRYGQGKLANVLYTAEIARRYPWLTTASLEPGTVWTGLFSHLSLLDRFFLAIVWPLTGTKTIAEHEGAYNTCWAATTEKSNVESGKFYKPVGVRVPAMGHTEDEELAKRLWVWTQTELKHYD